MVTFKLKKARKYAPRKNAKYTAINLKRLQEVGIVLGQGYKSDVI